MPFLAGWACWQAYTDSSSPDGRCFPLTSRGAVSSASLRLTRSHTGWWALRAGGPVLPFPHPPRRGPLAPAGNWTTQKPFRKRRSGHCGCRFTWRARPRWRHMELSRQGWLGPFPDCRLRVGALQTHLAMWPGSCLRAGWWPSGPDSGPSTTSTQAGLLE